jgi:hypothetical protein
MQLQALNKGSMDPKPNTSIHNLKISKEKEDVKGNQKVKPL